MEGDIPTNNASSGEIEGIGQGPKGEPGVSVEKQKEYAKKNKIIGRKPFAIFLDEITPK